MSDGADSAETAKVGQMEQPSVVLGRLGRAQDADGRLLGQKQERDLGHDGDRLPRPPVEPGACFQLEGFSGDDAGRNHRCCATNQFSTTL